VRVRISPLGIIIVGQANKITDEARDQIRGASVAGLLTLPHTRITINLVPVDVPKDPTGFDLAIATTMLAATQLSP
jgi:magnesium chelatase family protein